jgi:predicted GNAT family N-acyltransferase
MYKTLLISEETLSDEQKLRVEELMKQCFSHVDAREAEECFCAESFARILAYSSDKLVGHLRLFKRNIEFDRMHVALGGIGGVCVSEDMRRRGIATRMVREALKVLKHEKVDVACLNADLSRNGHRFYERIGFRLMDRRISFEDVYGKIRYDDGTMLIPICSKEIYEQIMRSDKTFHYGRGYW